MLRIARAEVLYNAKSLLAWFAVLLTVSLWPLFESPSVDSFPTILVFLVMYLPFLAVIGNLRLLSIERHEKRLRLFRTLPITTVQLAAARLLRGLALPLLTLGVSLALLLAGLTLAGPSFLASLAGAWVLLTLLFLGVAAANLSTLLYDIGGMTFAQISAALLVLAFLLNASSPLFQGFAPEPLTRLAQTPLGVLLALGLGLLLALCDLVVFIRRRVA